MSNESITITGLVATTPRHIVTGEGLPITSFRLAAPHRRFDAASGKWADTDTNWYTIVSFRQLATNAARSLNKGERVILSGKLRIREWETDDKTGTNVEVEAEAIGHDLTWGTSVHSRTPASVESSEEEGSAGATA